ncbi:MAG: response regulator [Acidobacteriota bacterium]|nr:response regulator [Acidobacteriota bacterium]
MLEKFRILIVDDDRLVLDLMMHAARRHPVLQAEKTSDSAEAIRKIKENPPYHIILTDLSMPGYTGLDVLRAARTRSPDTRGIIVTGFGDKESTREAIKLGVSDYLNKPFRIEEMDLALRNAIEHFELRKQGSDYQTQIQDLETGIKEKALLIEAMEAESNILSTELTQLTEKDAQNKARTEALLKAVAAKTGHQGAPITPKLLDNNGVINQKKMTEEEFQAMKKNLLDRTYKSIVG